MKSIKSNNGPKIDPCGTPASTLAQAEIWPLSLILCLVLFKKSIRIFTKSLKLKFATKKQP